jgi:hypothetical protein
MAENRQPEIPLRPGDGDPKDAPSRIPLAVPPEDQDAVAVFLAVLGDNPTSARALLRSMSPRDLALLSYYLREAGRLAEEETETRVLAESRWG